MKNRLLTLLFITLSVAILASTQANAQEDVLEELINDIETIKSESIEAETTEVEPTENTEEIEKDFTPDIQNVFDTLPFSGTSMFTSKEASKLYDAVVTYFRNKNIREHRKLTAPTPTITSMIPDESEGGEDQSITETPTAVTISTPSGASSYTLNSILYYNKDSWSVWVNGKQIRSNETDSSIIVDRVYKDYAYLIVQNTGFDSSTFSFADNFVVFDGEIFDESLLQKSQNISLANLTPGQRAQLTKSRTNAFTNKQFSWKYKSKDNNIFIDSNNGIFRFKIKTNQTFSTATIHVNEGSTIQKKTKDISATTNQTTSQESEVDSSIEDSMNELSEDDFEFDF